MRGGTSWFCTIYMPLLVLSMCDPARGSHERNAIVPGSLLYLVGGSSQRACVTQISAIDDFQVDEDVISLLIILSLTDQGSTGRSEHVRPDRQASEMEREISGILRLFPCWRVPSSMSVRASEYDRPWGYDIGPKPKLSNMVYEPRSASSKVS